MPLINDKGLVSHSWIEVSDDEAFSAMDGDVLLPFALFEQLPDWLEGHGGRVGVIIESDTDLAQLEPWLDRLALIAIRFKTFSDGRGFSLARRLRRIYRYTGSLWAKGHLIADQYAFARRCGFDAVDLDFAVYQRQPAADWLDAANDLGLAYQRDDAAFARSPASIFDLRRAARLPIAAE